MPTLIMLPSTGERVLRFVGDRLRISLGTDDGSRLPEGWRVLLRTNLGRAEIIRREIIEVHHGKGLLQSAAWHDLPMHPLGNEWTLDLPMTDAGFFHAKAYAVDPQRHQHWPDGPDLGISIHPNAYRTANTTYCAFVRMFGESKRAVPTRNPAVENQLKQLDAQSYTVIPPSGKLRDLVKLLPFIVGKLGCRILHLLPINPTPTTYARFGRYGSPYATQDLMAVDPALVEFDKRTTGAEQFCELAYACHSLGARVFLDLAINHTGWGSALQENHPGWFLRNPDGTFASPGAWGTTWEDLVELDHRSPVLWEYLARVFLTWCRRGVDGFRCDAGYKVPLAAWRYIIATVRQEFPETIFLLEGLGGSWETTETLLTLGGMQWAYSELFQNFSGRDVATYLDYSWRQSERVGVYVHYSETHDNDRLAATSRAWSLMRNRLSALASVNGAFAFTGGVEWLATEKINVHSCRGLAWDNPDNIVAELATLNELLASHPCFLDGAKLTRLSPIDSPVCALQRESAEGLDRALVLVNTDVQKPQRLALEEKLLGDLAKAKFDLLAQPPPVPVRDEGGSLTFELAPGACCCLVMTVKPAGLSGTDYRLTRARCAFAAEALARVLPMEKLGPYDWRALAKLVEASPRRFLSSLAHLDTELASSDLLKALETAAQKNGYAQVVTWTLLDQRRITLVPPNHWLLIEDDAPFRVTLTFGADRPPLHRQSIEAAGKRIACFQIQDLVGDAGLHLERYGTEPHQIAATIRCLSAEPQVRQSFRPNLEDQEGSPADLTLLTNGRGGMARLRVDLGAIASKYDCLLGANLHPSVPVDRHIFAKRARVWLVADGFISPLNQDCLLEFLPGPPASWRFVAGAGDGRSVEIHLTVDMIEGCNTTVLRFLRPAGAPAMGIDLPPETDVRLTLRVDIEDRNFHTETHHNGGAEFHFASHCRPLHERIGFEFTPAADRHLRVVSDAGEYHPEPEWCDGITHPVEATRGQVASGDAYSPGWFDLPLAKNSTVTLTVSAEAAESSANGASDSALTEQTFTPALSLSEREREKPSQRWDRIERLEQADAPPIGFPLPLRGGKGQGEGADHFESRALFIQQRQRRLSSAIERASLAEADTFGRQLARSIQGFVAQRNAGKTVIAGYPWFLDWGRDSLISARGLLSAGRIDEVRDLLVVFGRFAEKGTLPNSIHGEDASNRDTSDAPLWYGIVCEELAALAGETFYGTAVDQRGRTIADILREIAEGYRDGTANGILMDPASGLIWSPPHFTWMDTNFPAGTPREGYPIEIQVLWIRLLRQLAKLGAKSDGENWTALATRAEESLRKYFWLEAHGYLADLLIAKSKQSAAEARADDALRSNSLFAISLGLLTDEQAQRVVEAAARYLVVPGALRSLAPLKVSPPLPIHGNDGRLLNQPEAPYWGRYDGDEDSRRKPAYHNGTAWTWTFPVFCEALARAWNFSAPAVAAAKAYLGSTDQLLNQGCLGHLPEIVDGDAPHTQRGCDAQAWSAAEALRVWKLLNTE